MRPTPPKTPASGTDASGNPLTLEMYNFNTFGFLRMTVSPASITGEFVTVDPTSGKTGVGDSFTLDLKANTVANGLSSGKTASSKPQPKRRASTVAPKSRKSPQRVTKSAPKAGSARPKGKGKSTRGRKK
jgi:hypothetical protein